MQQHRITLDGGDATYYCREDESLLSGMHRLGRHGVPFGCRNGGCGVCKIHFLEGRYATSPMSCAHVSVDEETNGCVLACRVFPGSELRLRVVGQLGKRL